MQHPMTRRHACLMAIFALGMGIVISISACAPGGAGVGAGSTNPTGAPQSTSTPPPQITITATSEGTVDGLVVAGPSCPVERAEDPCPPKPVPDRLVVIETPGGKVVTRVTTDQQGHFTVRLAPGTYDLQVPSGSSPYPVQHTRQQVNVVAGQTVQVQVLLDSGIR